MAGVMGALYLTARPGSSVMSRTLHPSSGTSSFIPSKTETTFSLTSFGVQHEAINTSTCIHIHHSFARGMTVLLGLASFPGLTSSFGLTGTLSHFWPQVFIALIT